MFKSDAAKAVRNILTMLAFFLLIVWVASFEKTLPLAIAGGAAGALAVIIFAAFEDKKAAPKAVIGWGVIGFLFGLVVGLWGI